MTTTPSVAERFWVRLWRQWSFDDSWLLEEADHLEREIESLATHGSEDLERIKKVLGDARRMDLDRQARWAAIHHAEEMALGFLDPDRLAAVAERLVHTAESENFPDRLMALIRDLIAPSACVGGGPSSAPPCGRVREAMEESHAYFRYVYRANSVTSRWRVALLCCGLLALLLIFLIFHYDRTITADLAPSVATGALTMLAGVLGAVTSAIQRLARDPVQGTVPARIGSFTAVGTRLFVGAVAGLSAYAAALASLQDQADSGLAITLLAAFGAGFAERLATISPSS